MATALQARVANRGFPVFDASGQAGQGTRPDSTLPSGIPAGSPTSTWTDPNVDPASVGATLPPPEAYVLSRTLWGLPGAANPDDTSRTHAAPFADPTLPAAEYNAELDAAHGPVFDGVQLRRHPGTVTQFGYELSVAQGSPAGPLQPLAGQIRSMAGFDGVQGYGGGADGPGGVNASMPLTVSNIDFPGETYHAVFVSAAEVPLYVPDADQFIASAPELPAWTGGGFDVPTASVHAQDVNVADAPAQGPALAPAGGLLPLWGT